MSLVGIGTVCAMHPGCIRSHERQSWGITLADAAKLLFVWDHELTPDKLWVNLYDPRKDAPRYGGKERRRHIEAIQNGTKGWALIGFNQPDPDGSQHWYIDRGDINNPYIITAIRADSNDILWGNLKRPELIRPAWMR